MKPMKGSLYILIVEKKPIIHKKVFKRLKDNDEERFRFWQWLLKQHKNHRHMECFIHTEKEKHIYFLQKYHSCHCMEFEVPLNQETKEYVNILFETHYVAQYHDLERDFYVWLSSTLQRIVSDVCKSNKNVISMPLEYISRSIASYADFSYSLFRTCRPAMIAECYKTTVTKIARSMFYLIREILGYNIPYPFNLQPVYYHN